MKTPVTIKAWATSDWAMEELLDGLNSGDMTKTVGRLLFSHHDMSNKPGWVHVGTAQITVDILPVDQLQHSQLAALQAELQKERADSQVRQNLILERISKLQALEFAA